MRVANFTFHDKPYPSPAAKGLKQKTKSANVTGDYIKTQKYVEPPTPVDLHGHDSALQQPPQGMHQLRSIAILQFFFCAIITYEHAKTLASTALN